MSVYNGKWRVILVGNQVCMKRGLDAERLQRYFIANGCELVKTPEHADIIVAMTCAFIGSYVKTATHMIQKLKARKVRMVVLGCLPAMAPDDVREVFDGPMLATKDLDQIDRLFPEFKVPLSAIPDANFPDVQSMCAFDPAGPTPIYIRNSVASGHRPGPFIRVAWGCRNNCAYCSHPAALGPLKSKPLETCLEEYRGLLAAGHKHVVLHANDPAAYGLDIGLTYPMLLQKFDDTTPAGGVSWTLNDVNPAQLVRYCDELLPFFRKGRVIHLAVPMQSGSPAVLRRMRRYDRVDAVISAMEKIRETSPSVRLTTHLLVGFPGETTDDLDMTVSVIERCGYDRALVFPFSANRGTAAERMEGQLSRAEILQRQSVLCDRLTGLGLTVDRFQ